MGDGDKGRSRGVCVCVCAADGGRWGAAGGWAATQKALKEEMQRQSGAGVVC